MVTTGATVASRHSCLRGFEGVYANCFVKNTSQSIGVLSYNLATATGETFYLFIERLFIAVLGH